LREGGVDCGPSATLIGRKGGFLAARRALRRRANGERPGRHADGVLAEHLRDGGFREMGPQGAGVRLRRGGEGEGHLKSPVSALKC
jgi:hypothetical protein